MNDSLVSNGRRLYDDDVVRALSQQALQQAHAPAEDAFNYQSLQSVNERASAAVKLPFYALGQRFFTAIPETQNPIMTAIKEAGHRYFMVEKHNNGKILFENPFKDVPVLGKIVQNGWSTLHFAGGLTTIDSLYTMVDQNGDEVPIYLQGKGETNPTLEKLCALAEISSKNYGAVKAEILQKLFKLENREATNANCYEELTDNDVLELELVNKRDIMNIYMPQELWLTGQVGKKEEIKTDKPGLRFIRRKKPGPLELFKFYSISDLVYTALDIPFEPLEKIVGRGLADAGLYTGEMVLATNVARQLYGDAKQGGARNPVNYMM